MKKRPQPIVLSISTVRLTVAVSNLALWVYR